MAEETSWAAALVARPQDVISDELPLEYVVEVLYGVRIVGTGNISCPFPDHDDEHPSFHLWEHDERGFAHRFKCFGCGKTGDLFDLVGLARGVGFSGALEIAREELLPVFRKSGWKLEARALPNRRPGRSPEELLAIIDGLKPLSQFGFDVVERFFRAKADESGREDLQSPTFGEYALSEWEWSGAGPAETHHGIPVVVFPHRSPSGAVTGIKYRDPRLSGGRWTEPGSKFPYLYGSWRSRGARSVLLCEGETDTVFAAFALRDRTDIDVFGLPSGASARPTTEALSLLADRKTVYLAFDADAAGEAASRAWYVALSEIGLDVFVVRLPAGTDVLSSRSRVGDLLDRATVPRRFPGVVGIEDGVFVRYAEKKGERTMVAIADFGVEIDSELAADDGPAYEGLFLDDRKPFLLRTRDLGSASRFITWAGRYGRVYLGPPSLVQYVASYVSASASFKPLERTTTRAGRIGRSYVWPGGHLGGDQLRYVAPTQGDVELSDRLRLRPGSFDPGAIRALETMNDPALMAAVLAWLTATLLRGRSAPAPPLFVSGESGAGKTEMLATVLGSFGFGLSAQLSSTTPFAVDNLVNATVGFPVWFDEYRRSAREDSMIRLQQLLRDAFGGLPSMKGLVGGSTLGLAKVETWSGIVVSGEMASGETSHRDRLLLLELDPAAKNAEPYFWLTADKSRTEGLGYAFLEYLVGRPESHFRLKRYSGDVPDRFREVLGFVRAGWEAWREFRRRLGVSEPLAEPDYAGLVSARRASEDPYIEAIRALDGVPGRGGDLLVTRHTDGSVKVRPHEVVANAKLLGITLPAGPTELKRYLSRRFPGTYEHRVGNGGARYFVIPGLDLDS